MMRHLFFAILVIGTFIKGIAQPSWQNVGGGTNLSVQALETDTANNHLYAGGLFVFAGSTLAPGVAKWDGSSWSTLGSGLQLGTGISALLHENGSLYAGGTFTNIGGVLCKNIAEWNGTSWLPLGAGLDFIGVTTVNTMRKFNNEIYAGGLFSNSGPTLLSNIARWNGSAWSPAGSGVNGPVYAMEVYNGELYVGGSFTQAGGVAVKNIAKWDGTNWSDVGGGVDDLLAPVVRSLRIYNGELYVGGTFTTAGTTPVNHLAKWDGANWTDPGGGVEYTGATTVSTLRVYKNQLIVGGSFDSVGVASVSANFVAAWDGTTWSPMGAGMNNSVLALSVVGDTLYAGGNFTQADNNTALFVAQWHDPAAGIITSVPYGETASEFVVFPNPSSSLFCIRPPQGFDSGKKINLSITDVSGRVVLQRNNCAGAIFVDAGTLADGVYCWKITNENGALLGTAKLIKTK